MNDAPSTGTVGSATDLPEISFVTPLPGLPKSRRFALIRLDEVGALFSLRSLDEPGLRLIVAAPGPFYPDYAPEIHDEAAEALGLSGPDDAAVLLVVNPGSGAGDATVNLLAPLVVNHRQRRAMQVLLSGSDLPLRAPLVP